MKLLLDTCTFLWAILEDPSLSAKARELILSDQNEVFVSAVTSWEIAVKVALGQLVLPERPQVFISRERERSGFESLSLNEESTLYVGQLPALHRDPFDRMLICQSIVHGMSLLTPDEQIRRYPVHTLW